MAITIYTYRTAVGTNGTLWVTSGTYRLKTGANFDLWCKITDTSASSLTPPTATASGSYFSVGTITTKENGNGVWIGTIRLTAGTATTNTNQTLTISYGGTTSTRSIRVNGTANGFSTNPTLASNFTYDDSNHAPITAWGASKSANLHWAMSTSNVVPPDSGWANALSSFTSVIRNAGTYYLWYKMQSTSTTYNDVPPTVYTTSIVCSKATLTCTGSSHTVTYGAAVPTLSITYSGWKGDDGTSDLTTLPTVSTSYTSSSNVSGSPYPVTVSGGSATNYSFSYVNGSITVNKAASRLSLTPTSATVYTQKTYDVSTAVQAHDGTVTYAITASTTTGTSSITSAGVVTCGTMSTSNDTDQSITVTVSDPGDGNHNAGSKTFTITVVKYDVSISWNNSTSSVTYGNTLSVSATATSNPTGGTVGTLSYSLSSTTYFTISGSTVTAVQYSGSTTTTVTCSHARTSTVKAGSTTRTLTCGKATLTCTGSSHTITYGDAKPTLSITYSGWKFSDSTSSLATVPTVSTTYTQGSNKGSYATTVSGGSATNYTFSYVSGSITVNARTATLSWGTVTWTYDGSSHSTTCTVSNLYGSDSCTVTLTGNSVGPAVATATATASSLSNSNYALPSSKTKTLSVTQKEVTLTWGTTSWTYNGDSHSTTCTAGSLVSGDTCTVTLSNNSVGPDVGSQTVTASSLSNSNYKLPSANTKSISITAKTVSLTWGTLTWTYDGNTHSTTCTAGDLVPQTTCTVTLTGNSVGKNVGTATVTASSLSNSNYALPSAKTATLTISAREVSLTWGTTSWVYDGSTHSTTCTAGNLVSGDTCTVTLTGNSVGKNVGSATVTASALSNSNYKLPSANTKNIYVTARTATLSWGTTSWTYDRTAHSTTCTVSNLVSGDTCTVTLSNNSITNVGSVTVTATALSNSNYALPVDVTKTISVTALTATLSWGTLTWTYDKSSHSTTCTVSNVISGDTCTVTLTGNSVGPAVATATVTASALSNSNYALPSTKTATLKINAKEVTLTWGTTTWVYDKTEHSTTCTAGGLISGDTCTVTLTNNAITNVGSVTVTASSLSNSNYKLPSANTKSISVTAKEVGLSWGTTSWTYDGSTHSTTCTATGLLSGDSCTVTLTGNSVGKNVGSTTVTVSSLSNTNYKLPSANTKSISVVAREITLTWGTTSWVYDKTAHSTTCTAGNLVSGDTCTVTLTNNSITNAGSVTVTASSLSNSNYKLPSSKTKNIYVTAKEVGCTWGTTSWTYDKSTHSTTCTLTGIISGDTCTATLSGNSVGADVGTATVSVSALSNSNYQIPTVGLSTTLSITAKTVGLSWGTTSWVYDKSSHSTTCTATGVISGDTCTVTLTGNSVGPAVATATVTASSLSNSNYALPSSKTATLKVTAKEVGLSWGTITWTYDGDTHSTTCTATGVLSGDTCTITLTGNSVGKNAGTATVTASSLSNSNYKLPSANTNTLTINTRTATLSWGTTSWTYDGNTHSTNCSVGNLVTGDTCTVTLSGNSVGANVGSATVTATALSNSNYALPSTKTTTISITTRAVTITAADKSKTYGDANPTFTASVTSGSLVSSSDLGTISATCTATQGSVVGTYTITPSYTANTNYTVTSVNGTLTVGKRTVSITFGSTKSWTYDGSAHSVTITVGNLYSTDAIGYTATGNSITNYGSSTVTVTGITGDKVANYQLPSSGLTTTISITKRAVTLTAANKSKTYGDANPTLTSSITSGSLVSSGDLGTLGATTTATQSSAVGTYTITPTYTANTNYSVTTANGTLTVNKRTVTITWGTVSWVYDGSAHGANPTLGNIYGSDVVRYTITGNSITHKGTTTATITALDNSNYQLPSSGTSATLTITQATTVLTWSSYSASMRVGDTQTVSATTNFGTVAYSSSNTAVATMSGAVITGVSNGTSTITASVATNSYGDWTVASMTFVLTVANGVKVYYNGSYVDAIPYVYYNGEWKKAIVYVYDGSSWKSC